MRFQILSTHILLLLSCVTLAGEVDSFNSKFKIDCIKENIIPINSNKFFLEGKTKKRMRAVSFTKIVGLGETSHGSHEEYELKCNLIKYLISERGYKIIVFEAGLAEGFLANEALHNSKMLPIDAIMCLKYGIYKTSELVELFTWIRIYNNSNADKVKVYGIDMQYYQYSLQVLKSIISKDSTDHYNFDLALLSIETTLGNLDNYRRKNKYTFSNSDSILSNVNTFLSNLTILENYAQSKLVDSNISSWFIANIEILKQFYFQFSPKKPIYYRDSCMAQNFNWIYQTNKNSKFIIWAHNGHIQKEAVYKTLGHYLNRRYSIDYTAVAFTFNSGFYNIRSKNGSLIKHKAQMSYHGSIENLLHNINEPYFILNMMNKNNCLDFLDSHYDMRSGGGSIGNEFYKVNVSNSYDAIVFSDISSCSLKLKK